MSLFDQLVDEAIKNRRNLAPLRNVVEKELLHHDILRALSNAGLLSQLTFIGGTCLRACYGSSRLSEDLDFTGGADFDRETLASMSEVLIDSLKRKYGLNVLVSEPTREHGNVDTWKIKVQTRPTRKDLPAQRINIDICAIPSYQPQPRLLLNPYGVDMGTGGLIVQAETREEIYADKIVAFALRPNRIKNRDLWDMVWLHQQSTTPHMALVPLKLKDHHCSNSNFVELLNSRVESLSGNPLIARDFSEEMKRFLPTDLASQTIVKPEFWTILVSLLSELSSAAKKTLTMQRSAMTQ